MRVCETELVAGDTFIIEPNEIADPIFHEDCTILCVKVPSSPKDKYLV
jgi:quercetin dioxygenase-like cupin family protein